MAVAAYSRWHATLVQFTCLPRHRSHMVSDCPNVRSPSQHVDDHDASGDGSRVIGRMVCGARTAIFDSMCARSIQPVKGARILPPTAEIWSTA